MAATNEVRQTGLLASALNLASTGIQGSIGLVGRVADSALGVGGDLAKVVGRMAGTNNTSPTPIESYVSMVSRQNATNATAA